MKIFVGRQPILDLEGKILGYELLYRNSEKNFFPGINPEEATIELLINTFLSIGVNELLGEGLSFINFSGNLLVNKVIDNLDPTRVVIEILEDVEITAVLLLRLKEIKEDGFKIALDDYILQEEHKANDQLFRLINYIKVDFIDSTPSERLEVEEFTKKYPHIQLLAEKIETKGEYELAKRAGYTLFQGYFFARPEVVEGYEIPPNINLHFQIINQMNAKEATIFEIAALIMRDVSLSYKLLRFINSPAVSVRMKVSSITQALTLMGLSEAKKWMHVLALRELRENKSSGTTQALVEYSLTRAKVCELLAIKEGRENPEEYFLAGMLSLMNVIMKKEWEDVLALIPVSDKVSDTLKGLQTRISPYIEIAEAIERFDLERLEILTMAYNIPYDDMAEVTAEANSWSQMVD